jgi:hypothetical protein
MIWETLTKSYSYVRMRVCVIVALSPRESKICEKNTVMKTGRNFSHVYGNFIFPDKTSLIKLIGKPAPAKQC